MYKMINKTSLRSLFYIFVWSVLMIGADKAWADQFVRVTRLGEITDGAQCLIVRQDAAHSVSGYCLDGTQPGAARKNVSISNYTITLDNTDNAFTFEKDGGNYVITNVNGGHLSLWLEGKAMYDGTNRVPIIVTEDNDGFTFRRDRNWGSSGCLNYAGDDFTVGESEQIFYLYMNVKEESSAYVFTRIRSIGDITTNEQYLIASSDKALDGNATSVREVPFVVNNNVVMDERNSFVISTPLNGATIQGVGGSRYPNPKDDGLDYSANKPTDPIYVQSDNKGDFYIYRRKSNNDSKYISYANGFTGRKNNPFSLSLYKRTNVNLTFSQSLCESAYSANGSVSTPSLNVVPSGLPIVYSSSNTNVATVDSNSGNVTMKGVGTAIITATYQNSFGVSKTSYLLKVNRKDKQQAGFGAWFDGNSGGFVVGTTGRITNNYSGDGTLIYSSSNEDIVRVDAKGVATAMSPGTAVITVAAPETDNYYSASATITLKVISGYSAKSPNLQFNTVGNVSTLLVGESVNTSYSRNGQGAVVYYSSDTNVATIDESGVIRGVGVGTVKLYATVLTYGEYNAETKFITLEVTESLKNSPNLQFHTVDDATSLYVGGELATEYTRDGIGKVTFTSDNESVATVDLNTGVISGVGEGTAIITATVAETDNYRSESKSITVTVNKRSAALNIKLDKVTAYVDDEVGLSVTYNGTGAVSYSSSNPAVAVVVVDDGYLYVKAKAEGKTNITVSVASDGTYSADTKTVEFTVNKIPTVVTPSFVTRVIRVGGTATLTLGLDSRIVHYTSSDPSIASVNETTGEIIGKSIGGPVTIHYVVDANNKFTGAEGDVYITVSNKDEAPVEVNPTSISLAIGGMKDVTIAMGECRAEMRITINDVENVEGFVKSYDEETNTYVYTVVGKGATETFMTVAVDESDDFAAKVINIPITVLDIYQYTLDIVNPPSYGVSVRIFGRTYTESCIFNSHRDGVSVADVEVKYLPSYSSEVYVEDHYIRVTYALRTPGKGSFIRLKNYKSGKYVSLVADGENLIMTESSQDNIIYYDEDGRFLYYKNGQFVKNTNVMASVADASLASSFVFTKGDGDYSECFSIRDNQGKYLLGDVTATSVGSSDGNDYAYWYVEMLESLPVKVSASGYGYGSLYCPVTLELTGGLDAYYIVSKSNSNPQSGTSAIEYRLNLEQLTSVIPANTPVVLVGVPGTTYDCPIKYNCRITTPESGTNVVGHCAAQVSADVRGSGTIFALQAAQGKEKVGFYPWTQTNLSGFKCYFVEDVSMASAYYRLVFGEETTVLPSVVAIEDTAVYNLCGQHVADSLEGLPRGIYIRGGRKVIVR